VLQVIILLDGAYNLNDSWVEKADNGEEEYLKYLVGISLFLYTSSFVGLVLLFTYFGGCPANDFFNSMTLIVTVAMTVIQLTGQYGTLFTGAVVTSYAVYLDYTACSQNPSESCNPTLDNDASTSTSDIFRIIIGISILAASVVWICYSTSKNVSAFQEGAKNEASKDRDAAPVATDDATSTAEFHALETGGETTAINSVNSDEKPVDSRKSDKSRAASFSANDVAGGAQGDAMSGVKFNLVMVVAAMYMGMIVTNWGAIREGGTLSNASAGSSSMWVSISGQWITMLLYLWTLLAPRLFPDRDFGAPAAEQMSM